MLAIARLLTSGETPALRPPSVPLAALVASTTLMLVLSSVRVWLCFVVASWGRLGCGRGCGCSVSGWRRGGGWGGPVGGQGVAELGGHEGRRLAQ